MHRLIYHSPLKQATYVLELSWRRLSAQERVMHAVDLISHFPHNCNTNFDCKMLVRAQERIVIELMTLRYIP
jgi:hypothetical protein